MEVLDWLDESLNQKLIKDKLLRSFSTLQELTRKVEVKMVL